MQEINDSINELGASLVAISPQLRAYSSRIVADNAINFDILRDPGNDYTSQLGLRFRLPADLRAIYSRFGLDLAECNGDDSWTLPMPARLVIDPEGIVRGVDAHPDYKTRPEPEKTLADLRALL